MNAPTSLMVLPTEQEAALTYKLSTNAATLCRAIVLQTVQTIQNKRYVPCTGWQAIAVAHGCTASSRAVEAIEGGIRAIGEVRRMDTGAVIAEAEGFVGDDEKMWASRPMYARRAMAQTRAISRACRSAFAHVVVMIDKELGTTPAEEMMGVTDTLPDIKQEAQEINRQQNLARRKAGMPPMRKAKPSRAEWTADLIDDITETISTEELDMMMGLEDNVAKLAQLAEQNHSLWQKIEDAEREQRAKLEARGS